jgi:hypothetical protein
MFFNCGSKTKINPLSEQAMDAYNDCPGFATFEAPKDKLIHVIWNVLLCDKYQKITSELVRDNQIGHVIAILPEVNQMPDTAGVDHTVLAYHDVHEPTVNVREYDQLGEMINEMAQETPRRNALIFCNNGYQRSLPFICRYLTKYHPDEVPSLDAAIDLILPQLSKGADYIETRAHYMAALDKLNLMQ